MVDVFPKIFRPASPRRELYSLFQIKRPSSPRNVYDDHRPALDWPFITPVSVGAPVVAVPQPTQPAIGPSTILDASGGGLPFTPSDLGMLAPVAHQHLTNTQFAKNPFMGLEPRDLGSSDLYNEPGNVPRWRDSMPSLEREYFASIESVQANRMESMYRAVSEERERLHRAAQRQQEDRSMAQREALVAMVQKREDEIGIVKRVANCFLSSLF